MDGEGDGKGAMGGAGGVLDIGDGAAPPGGKGAALHPPVYDVQPDWTLTKPGESIWVTATAAGAYCVRKLPSRPPSESTASCTSSGCCAALASVVRRCLRWRRAPRQLGSVQSPGRRGGRRVRGHRWVLRRAATTREREHSQRRRLAARPVVLTPGLSRGLSTARVCYDNRDLGASRCPTRRLRWRRASLRLSTHSICVR